MLLLLACAAPDSQSDSVDHDSPPHDPVCVEVARAVVTDPNVAPDGFHWAAQATLDAVTGDFVGAHEGVALAFSLTPGVVEAVRYGLEGGGASCDFIYETAVQVGFTTEDGRYAESFAATLVARNADDAEFLVDLDPESVSGTTTPPDELDSPVLEISGGFEGTWDGWAGWENANVSVEPRQWTAGR
ncbi:MAG: hypothetical protein V4850_30780 [Myxococcota bacterium]